MNIDMILSGFVAEASMHFMCSEGLEQCNIQLFTRACSHHSHTCNVYTPKINPEEVFLLLHFLGFHAIKLSKSCKEAKIVCASVPMIHSEASSLTHLFQSDLPDQNLPEKTINFGSTSIGPTGFKTSINQSYPSRANSLRAFKKDPEIIQSLQVSFLQIHLSTSTLLQVYTVHSDNSCYTPKN